MIVWSWSLIWLLVIRIIIRLLILLKWLLVLVRISWLWSTSTSSFLLRRSRYCYGNSTFSHSWHILASALIFLMLFLSCMKILLISLPIFLSFQLLLNVKIWQITFLLLLLLSFFDGLRSDSFTYMCRSWLLFLIDFDTDWSLIMVWTNNVLEVAISTHKSMLVSINFLFVWRSSITHRYIWLSNFFLPRWRVLWNSFIWCKGKTSDWATEILISFGITFSEGIL